MPKFSTLMDVAFIVEHDCEDTEDISCDLVIAALEKRLAGLKTKGSFDFDREAFGINDTYAIMDKPSTPKTYKVILCREASQSVSVDVTAESPEQANELALKMAGKYGENLTGWEVDDCNDNEVYLPDADSTEEVK